MTLGIGGAHNYVPLGRFLFSPTLHSGHFKRQLFEHRRSDDACVLCLAFHQERQRRRRISNVRIQPGQQPVSMPERQASERHAQGRDGLRCFLQTDWLAQRSGLPSALTGLCDMTMPGDGLLWQDGKTLRIPESDRATPNSNVPTERPNDMALCVAAA